MPQVSFGHLSKRKNSTMRPGGLSDSRNVRLKEATSIDNPTFIVQGNDFNYNYAKWDNRYYFVDNVVSVHDNLTEISCVLDVLATYKDEILASTQYVSYSSVSGGQWLADTRIPVLKNAITSTPSTANLDFPSTQGSYILTVLGQTGVDCFRVTRPTIQALIEGLQTWTNKTIEDIKDTFDFTDEQSTLESMTNAIVDSGFMGNAYDVAVQCIRSCHWVPFDGTVIGGTSTPIYLGDYPAKDTGGNQLYGDKLSMSWTGGNVGLSIPWHYSDWRRTYCETAYLYLPFVGMVSLSSDELVNNDGLIIKYSITPSDGQVCYEVSAGNQIVGTYGGNCSMQIPIGINQKASLGDIVTTMFKGAEKAVNLAVQSTISPVSMAAVPVAYAETAIQASYELGNVMMSTHPATVGGIGGGAGAGLDLVAKCFTVAHPTVIEPAQMALTMGIPTMKPVLLSQCSGYCQCVNAHVAAPAQATELNVIDSYLNSGFYIE